MIMRRHFFFTALLLFFRLALLPGQVTIFPEVDHHGRNEQSEIMRVEVNDHFTIVDFIFYPESPGVEGGNWACVDKATFITPSGREERMFLVMAKKISICPRMTKIVMNEGDAFTFQLYFPPLERNILKIDIIGKNMKLEGVSLSNVSSYPAADSSRFRSQEAFNKYFFTHRDQLDPLEGLWRLKVRRQHYMSNGTYLEEESLPQQVVAIIRQGETFGTYDVTGLNRREYFKKLSGKKGYFFRTLFPEVEGEASAYTIFSNPDMFYLKYNLPDRLAHYYLLTDYLPGMKMTEIAEYTRIPPEDPDSFRPVIDLGKDSVLIKN